MRFSSFEAFETHLHRLGLFHMDLGLERMERIVSRIPRRAVSVVQIVGTNGKGSTACFLSSIARAHGMRTLCFTSPHFVDVRERIAVNGAPLDREIWLEGANALFSLSGAEELTYFEVLTCLAWLLCDKLHIEFAVFEAGLGGRYDATTALSRDGVVFTPIGRDHQNVLGPTLARIAADKSGALQAGMVAVSASQPEPAARSLSFRAAAVGAPLSVSLPVLRGYGLEGHARELCRRAKTTYLCGNLRLALAMWALSCGSREREIDAERCRKGIERAWLPGRFHKVVSPFPMILDSAHNPSAWRVLLHTLRKESISPGSLIFACLRDKAWRNMVTLARGLGVKRLFLPLLADNERALDPKIVAEAFGPGAIICADTAEALQRAGEAPGPVLAAGSMYLLGEVYRLHPDLLSMPGEGWFDP